MKDQAAMRVYLKDIIGLQEEIAPDIGARREAVQSEGQGYHRESRQTRETTNSIQSLQYNEGNGFSSQSPQR